MTAIRQQSDSDRLALLKEMSPADWEFELGPGVEMMDMMRYNAFAGLQVYGEERPWQSLCFDAGGYSYQVSIFWVDKFAISGVNRTTYPVYDHAYDEAIAQCQRFDEVIVRVLGNMGNEIQLRRQERREAQRKAMQERVGS